MPSEGTNGILLRGGRTTTLALGTALKTRLGPSRDDEIIGPLQVGEHSSEQRLQWKRAIILEWPPSWPDITMSPLAFILSLDFTKPRVAISDRAMMNPWNCNSPSAAVLLRSVGKLRGLK